MRHTVRSGETLASIAQRHGLELDEVLRVNPHVANAQRLFPGQSVYLPRRGGLGLLSRWQRLAAEGDDRQEGR